MGTCATTLPLVASITISNLLSQPANRRFVALSILNPEGASPGAIDQLLISLLLLMSTTSISLLSSLFTNIFPAPSLTAVSGLPFTSIVATTLLVDGSIMLRFLLLPLQVITLLE